MDSDYKGTKTKTGQKPDFRHISNHHEDYLLGSWVIAADSIPVLCYPFSTMKVPPKKIDSIQKTHSGCPRPAFVVKTVEGRVICFQSSVPWVQKAFNRVKQPAAVATSSGIKFQSSLIASSS
nr:C-C motif chemokine 2 isoform X2 [Salvelinus alpinus]